MTRHNLAVNISWLLSSGVNSLTTIHTAPTVSITTSRATTRTVYVDSEEGDTEDLIQNPLPSPSPNRRIVRTVNVAPDFQRPPLPSKHTPKSLLGEPSNPLTADEPMGKISSASNTTRPGLVGQHQLATPASTTSSLYQGYSALLRATHGKLDTQVAFAVANDIFQAFPLRRPSPPECNQDSDLYRPRRHQNTHRRPLLRSNLTPSNR